MAPHIHIPTICRILHRLTSHKCGLQAHTHGLHRKLDKRCSTSSYNKRKCAARHHAACIKLGCPKVSYVQVYGPIADAHQFCGRVCVSLVEPRLERAIDVILSFYNSLTSYELPFFGISNFGFYFLFDVFFVAWLDVRWRDGNKFYADLSFCVRTVCGEKTGRL